MASERRISNMAEQQVVFMQDNYGIGSEIDVWCNWLVTQAIPLGSTGSGFDFSHVLETTAETMKAPESFLPSNEVELVIKAAKLGWDLLASLREVLQSRPPEVSIKIDSKIFHGFSDKTLSIEVVAIYEIDSKANTVTFRYFDWFRQTQDQRDQDSADRSRKW